MKKIGEGYYYNVFEIDNKVLKKVKNKLRIFLFILFANKFNILNTVKEYQRVIVTIPLLKNQYSKILNLLSEKNIVGNPDFINETDYTQDLVSNLRNINTLNSESFVKVINDYVDLLKKLWSFKISDSVFNFSVNCGYDSKDQLVLVDFNEMTFDKKEIADQIENKVWLQRFSYLSLTRQKQTIFKEIMDREINAENLDKYWGTRKGPN